MFRYLRALFWTFPVAFVACGGETSHHDDMRTSVDAGAAGAAGGATIIGSCTLDEDCVAVLDVRRAECWWPSVASRAEAERDACLMPWSPNPKCTLPPAPAGCVPADGGGSHPCPATPACVGVHCDAGKCALDLDIACPTPELSDCEVLRQRFVSLLEQGRQCDPSQDPPHCDGNLADTCGCELPYDTQGPYAQRISCAFDIWRNAGCPIVDCERSCVPPKGPAVCAPVGSAMSGSCQYPSVTTE